MYGSNITIDVYRLIYGTSTNTYPGMADIVGVEAYIESQSAEVTQVLGQQFNIETFFLFCDPIAIEAGDKVIDSNGIEYRVSGIEKHEGNFDSDDVYKIILHKQKSTSH